MSIICFMAIKVGSVLNPENFKSLVHQHFSHQTEIPFKICLFDFEETLGHYFFWGGLQQMDTSLCFMNGILFAYLFSKAASPSSIYFSTLAELLRNCSIFSLSYSICLYRYAKVDCYHSAQHLL